MGHKTIPVSKLLSNPFRDLKRIPLQQSRVESLIISIKKTSFWDNIVVRKVGEHYEIAYGHHRVEALKEIGIEFITVPVRDIDDGIMLLMMADENKNEWTINPALINETVEKARDFLNKNLKKSNDLRDFQSRMCTCTHTKWNEGNFERCKKYGAGKRLIKTFLGTDWSESAIAIALRQIGNKEKKDKVTKRLRKACEIFDSQKQSERFRKLMMGEYKDSLDDLNFDIMDFARKKKEEWNKPKPKPNKPKPNKPKPNKPKPNKPDPNKPDPNKPDPNKPKPKPKSAAEIAEEKIEETAEQLNKFIKDIKIFEDSIYVVSSKLHDIKDNYLDYCGPGYFELLFVIFTKCNTMIESFNGLLAGMNKKIKDPEIIDREIMEEINDTIIDIKEDIK